MRMDAQVSRERRKREAMRFQIQNMYLAGLHLLAFFIGCGLQGENASKVFTNSYGSNLDGHRPVAKR